MSFCVSRCFLISSGVNGQIVFVICRYFQEFVIPNSFIVISCSFRVSRLCFHSNCGIILFNSIKFRKGLALYSSFLL